MALWHALSEHKVCFLRRQVAADKLGGVVAVRSWVIWVLARPSAAEMRLCDHSPDLIDGDSRSTDAPVIIISMTPLVVKVGGGDMLDDDGNGDWADEVPLATSCLTLMYVEHCSRYFSGMLLEVTRDHLRVAATIRPQSCNREPQISHPCTAMPHSERFPCLCFGTFFTNYAGSIGARGRLE